jgi:hypothetical protein
MAAAEFESGQSEVGNALINNSSIQQMEISFQKKDIITAAILVQLIQLRNDYRYFFLKDFLSAIETKFNFQSQSAHQNWPQLARQAINTVNIVSRSHSDLVITESRQEQTVSDFVNLVKRNKKEIISKIEFINQNKT